MDIFTKSSSQAEINSCLDRVVDAVAGGALPNEAICDAVKRANLHPSGIQILVQAYNTAAINQQRLHGEDINEKTAAVTLANAEEITETLFPTPHKAASAGSLGATATLRKLASEAPYRRSHEDIVAGLKLLRSPETTKVAAAKPAEKSYFGLRNAALAKEAAANRELFNAQTKLAADVETLKHYLQQDAAPAVIELVERVKVSSGEAGVRALYGVSSQVKHLKLASQCRDFTRGVQLIRDIVAGVDRFQSAKAAATVATDAIPKSNVPTRAIYHTKSLVADDNAAAVNKELHVSDTGEKLAAEKAAAGPFTTAAVVESVRQLSKRLSGGLGSDPVEKNLAALSDPMHERRLNQIRSQATLVDLMNNDQMIAGHDPDEVIAAWNQLLELSPQLGDRRILAQGALRTRLAQGAMDPFASGQLVDLSQKLTPKPQTIQSMKPPKPPEPKF